MAQLIHRKAPGIYESEHFGIYYEGVVARRKEWKIRPLTFAARHIDVTSKCLSLQEAKEKVVTYEMWTRAWMGAHLQTIQRRTLTNLAMVAGDKAGRDRPRTIIDRETVKQWVGIGWVDERTATDDDYARYPVAID